MEELPTNELLTSLPRMFGRSLDEECLLVTYRNLWLWWLDDKDALPKPVIPLFSPPPTRLTKIQRLIRQFYDGGDAMHEKVERFFADHANLRTYFANVGCANIFFQYVCDESLTAAQRFFVSAINGPVTELMIETVANFVLHGCRFTKLMRERYFDELLRVNELNDEAKYLTLQRVLTGTLADLSQQHIAVLLHCLKQENGRDAVAKLLVKRVLVTCLKMWVESSEFCSSDLLKLSDGKWLWETLSADGFDYMGMCNDLLDDLGECGYCQAPKIADVTDQTNYVLSVLDIALLEALMNDKGSPELKDALYIFQAATGHGKAAEGAGENFVDEVRLRMSNYGLLQKDTKEIRDQIRTLSICYARVVPVSTAAKKGNDALAKAFNEQLSRQFYEMLGTVETQRIKCIAARNQKALDALAKKPDMVASALQSEKIWVSRDLDKCVKACQTVTKKLKVSTGTIGTSDAGKIQKSATIAFQLFDIYAEGQKLVLIDSFQRDKVTKKPTLTSKLSTDASDYVAEIFNLVRGTFDLPVIHLLRSLNTATLGRSLVAILLAGDILKTWHGQVKEECCASDEDPMYLIMELLLGDNKDEFLTSVAALMTTLKSPKVASIIPASGAAALETVQTWTTNE